MFFIIPQKQILPVLETISPMTDRKSTLNYQTQVLLSASAGGLTLCCADGIRSFTALLAEEGVRIDQTGSVACGAHDLLERVRSMPAGPIEIEVDGASYGIWIRAGGAKRKFRLAGSPGNEFPKFPDKTQAQLAFTVSSAVLDDLIERTKFAISKDETRPHVNSAYIEVHEHKIRMVATDGHRLTYAEGPTSAPVPMPPSGNRGRFLIPLRAVADIAKICGNVEGDVDISVHNATFFVSTATQTFTVQMTDREFPPYQQILPKPSAAQGRLLVDRAEAIAALEATGIASDDKSNGIKIDVRAGKMLFDTANPDQGSGHDEVLIAYSGPAVTTGVNARFLIEALKGMTPREAPKEGKADQVAISIIGELDPIQIEREPAMSEFETKSIVMPMRV